VVQRMAERGKGGADDAEGGVPAAEDDLEHAVGDERLVGGGGDVFGGGVAGVAGHLMQEGASEKEGGYGADDEHAAPVAGAELDEEEEEAGDGEAEGEIGGGAGEGGEADGSEEGVDELLFAVGRHESEKEEAGGSKGEAADVVWGEENGADPGGHAVGEPELGVEVRCARVGDELQESREKEEAHGAGQSEGVETDAADGDVTGGGGGGADCGEGICRSHVFDRGRGPR
jgi:hypothetical protein